MGIFVGIPKLGGLEKGAHTKGRLKLTKSQNCEIKRE